MSTSALALLLISLSSLFGCTTVRGIYGNYDRRTISVEFYDAFNQRLPEQMEVSWRGDWYFRRLRLSLQDDGLRNARPDILILQGAMNHFGSIVESDDEILGSGALKGYAWDVVKIADYEDTYEAEYHMYSVGLPLSFKRDISSSERVWRLNSDEIITAAITDLEDQPIVVLSVENRHETAALALLPDLEKIYLDILAKVPGSCPQRVILAGRVQNLMNNKTFRDWLERVGLIDASTGFCENAGQCFTAEDANELFRLITPSQSSGQYDRIFIPASALLLSSRRTQGLSRPLEDTELSKYGITQLWSTPRYGWNVNLRLQRCEGK